MKWIQTNMLVLFIFNLADSYAFVYDGHGYGIDNMMGTHIVPKSHTLALRIL